MTLAALRQRTTTWARDSGTTRGWRQRRYELFMLSCEVEPGDRILDVGAGEGSALERFNKANEIVAIDILPQQSDWLSGDNVSVSAADATKLPFADGEFPVGFSNSVIEHVPKDKQAEFAAEIRRVCDRYFVQTPNRYFPIEPHYQFPFFQFFPESVQKLLNRHFSLGWRAKGQWEPVSLLTARELRRLFPGAQIRRERLLGLTKSFMVIGRRDGIPSKRTP